MSGKNINLDPFNFSKLKQFYLKHGKIILLFSLLMLLFLGALQLCKYIIRNQTIFSTLEGGNKGVSFTKNCIGIRQNDKKLIFDLFNLLNDKKYFADQQVANVVFLNLPNTLDTFSDPSDLNVRKQVFIKAILPLIVKANQQVLEDRKHVLYLSSRMPKEELSDKDLELFKHLITKYKVNIKVNTPWDIIAGINALLVKVDVIPNSIALAIAIIETGWGQSRFLKVGNSLFSEWVIGSSANAIEPLKKDKNLNYGVKKFKNLNDSVESFFTNLNCSSLYNQFRNLRFTQMSKKGEVNVYALVKTLEHYAESKDYALRLQSVIRENNLTKYDRYKVIAKYKPICLYFY